jgi:hypothetical protein
MEVKIRQPCTGCGAEARLPGQRYGRRCMNEANQKYRDRLRELLGRIRQEMRNPKAK